MVSRLPYFRLSAFYLFYFASLGAFVPYWSVYLQSLGFAPRQIGELFAIVMLTKVFAPYLWGWIADHTGSRLRIIRLAAGAAALAFAGTLLGHGYGWLALVLVAFSFFWHAVLPQFEATTINFLGRERARYSHVRLWGSVGFIATVTGLGLWFERAPLDGLPAIMTGLLAGIWLATLLIPRSPPPPAAEDHGGAILGALRRPEVLAFLAACFLLQASHGPYYTFFSIYLGEHGYGKGAVGQLWALGVLAEIGVFLVFHRWLRAVGAAPLFATAALVTSLRWVLLALWVDVLPVLLLAQVMHAASYGLYHAAAIELVNGYFPGRLQGRGQALYASISFGLGNALGSLLSGYAWSGLGSRATFLLAAVACALGLAVALRWLPVRRPVPA